MLVKAVEHAPEPPKILHSTTNVDCPFVLLSGPGLAHLSRWSYAGLNPIGSAKSFEDAELFLKGFRDTQAKELPPFFGGAVGYITYDEGWRYVDRPRPPRKDPLGFPGQQVLLYDTIYAFDTYSRRGLFLSLTDNRSGIQALQDALLGKLDSQVPRGELVGPIQSAIDRETFQANVRALKALIREGEVYQVNYTYPLVGRYSGSSEAAFLRLVKSAQPFSAFLRLSETRSIVSASPECFFRLQDGVLSSYPIKGTRPHGETKKADEALKQELLRSPKDRAEHVMIVDLLRNDIGRIAKTGSVSVEKMAFLESFSHVHHLTSEIRGEVGNATPEKLLRALFPGGSVTGAPKLRAMEIIDQFEGGPRGLYTGSIGFVSPTGNMEMSIAIRTAQIADDQIRVGVGGGIVFDSSPEKEWRETQVKAKTIVSALSNDLEIEKTKSHADSSGG